jgi:hypothetical protein
MRRQNITHLMRLIPGLVLIFVFSGMAQAQGAPCNESPTGFCNTLPKVVIAPTFHANSIGIAAPNIGTLSVNVDISTYQNNVGSSKYVVSLRKGSPGSNPAIPSGTVIESKEVTVSGTAKEVKFSVNIDSCAKTGTYHVRISNTSTDNPQMGRTSINYFATPLETRTLDMQGTTLDLDKGNEATRTIGAINKAGNLWLRAKWHVPGPVPTYNKLKISVLRPDESVALASKEYYSYHYQEGSLKFNVNLLITGANVGLSGSWKLKIVNDSNHKIEGFNIRKEGDINPFVPEFSSIFTTKCGQ